MSCVLEARGLSKRYERREAWGRSISFPAVESVDLKVAAGEALVIVGESGCGKSTLLRCLAGFLKVDLGEVLLGGENGGRLEGEPRRRFFRRVQMVFQDPSSAFNPRLTLGQSIGEALVDAPQGLYSSVTGWLEAVGLEKSLGTRFPHQVSGGQRQRANLARALAAGPEVLLLDEPFSALDSETRREVLELLADLRQRLRIPMVIVGHDLSTLRRLASRVAVMYLGRVVELGPAQATFGKPLHPYTAMLLAAEPRLMVGRKPVETPIGDVPIPWFPPEGCPFHPRCRRAEDRCRAQVPALSHLSGDREVACHYPYLSPEAGVSAADDVTFARS